MKDLTKMMIFMFFGLVIAILVLGFHRSTPTTSRASNPTTHEQGMGV